MKSNANRASKSAVKARNEALLADLQAIRSQVAARGNPNINLEELEGLQRHLFEVWVAEKLAVLECCQDQSSADLEAAQFHIAELQNELAELRKEIGRLAKLNERLTARLAATAASRGKGRSR